MRLMAKIEYQRAIFSKTKFYLIVNIKTKQNQKLKAKFFYLL